MKRSCWKKYRRTGKGIGKTAERGKIKQDDGQEPPKSSGSGKANRNTSKKKQARQKKERHKKERTSDPDSGWFRKGEHKNVFAYRVQTACDTEGIILGYSVHPGNENDGRTFPALLEKLGHLPVETVVGDTAYKTPAIASLLKGKGIKLLSTGRPKTKKDSSQSMSMSINEYYDCYIYGISVSDSTVSRITDKILPIAKEWQQRPLENIYAVVFLDALHCHVRSEGQIVKKAVYIAIGVKQDGRKDVLGMWVGGNESAKFWASVLNGLRNRRVEDLFIACTDNLTGVDATIHAVFPQTEIQNCIVHQLRNTCPIRT